MATEDADRQAMQTLDGRARLEALADTLWAERHLVEYLLFKLVTAKLILDADERRFVTLALDEVERVVTALWSAELRRSQALAAVAEGWRVPQAELTLAELASRAEEPMRSVFLDHQEGFRKLTGEIEETAAANRKLAGAALAHVQETLGSLTGPTVNTTRTASGRADLQTPAPTRLNWVL